MEIRAHTSATSSIDKVAVTALPAAAAAKTDATPSQTAIAVQQAGAVSKEGEVAHAVQSINRVLQDRSQDLEFSVDPNSDRTVVKVVDKNTHEVIRQMPTQEALEIAKALDRLHSLLVRQQA